MIQNRDDYLEHSSKNYTAEQKQYNNWLTERLLEVADQHSYAFDPEDFNFMAIRDRIRCYYKSYVQTARKRGLELPGNAHLKRNKMSHPSDVSEAKSEKDEKSTAAESKEDASTAADSKTTAKTEESKDAREESKEPKSETTESREKAWVKINACLSTGDGVVGLGCHEDVCESTLQLDTC